MKKFVFLILLLSASCGFSSCADKIERYMDDPKTLFEDPLSVNHQNDLDALESRYLRKEITYADYLQQKRRLEDDYNLRAQKRQQIIEDSSSGRSE